MRDISYLSDGTKRSATDADGNGFRYEGSLVYRIQNGVVSLESAAFNGGRFVATDSGMEPRYFLTDHLGSTRAVVNAAGEVLERNDYYPFGSRWEDPESLLSDNRYRYNGKEEQAFVDVPLSITAPGWAMPATAWSGTASTPWLKSTTPSAPMRSAPRKCSL